GSAGSCLSWRTHSRLIACQHLHTFAQRLDHTDGWIRLHRLSIACMDVALSARLPVVIFENWHDRISDHRRHSGSSKLEHAGAHAFHGGRWSGYSRQALSVRVYHDCLWG